MQIFIFIATAEADQPCQALFPLGHKPIFIILLEAVIEYRSGASMRLLVPQDQEAVFETEAKRWLPDTHTIEVHAVPATACASPLQSITHWIMTLNIPAHADIIVIDTQYPLINAATIHHFVQECETGIVVAKVRNTTVYPYEIFEHNETTMIVFAGIFRCSVEWWMQNKEDDNWKNKLYRIRPWHMNHGFLVGNNIRVTNPEEHLHAEHVFLETKYTFFLNQCYSLWKKCLNLDTRVTHLEYAVLDEN